MQKFQALYDQRLEWTNSSWFLLRRIDMKVPISLLLFLVLMASAATRVVGTAQDSSEPRVIGGNVGVDGSYCESTKADFDEIAAVANERDSNVIIISRLGKGERSRSISRLRLSQIRNHLMMVRGYSSDRIIIAEGERVKGLGLVEVYIKGKPFIIYRMKRNRDFIRGNFGC